MSASTIGQKLEKKDQAAAFNPTHWSEENGGSGVPAGKLQVLEKFFTPVQQAKRRKERVYLPLQMESLDDRFSIHSSSSSTSTSSAMWSLEARLEKDTLLMVPSQYRSSPSGPSREVVVEGAASHHPTREQRRLGGSFTPFIRGVGTDDLPLRQGHPEFLPQVGQAEGLEQNFYKATGLQHGPAFSGEAEIPAPQQPSKTIRHPLGRVVLRNGVVEEDGRLWKTRSSETITERPTGTKPLVAPKPRRCQQEQQEKPSSPKSLDLNPPKKPLILGENRRIEDKLRFSEFLNEVTQQIMSPSNLMSLGWKSRGSSPTNRAPSTKSMSSESLLEKNEGKMSLPKRNRVGPFEAKGDATSIRPNQLQGNAKPVRTPDETSSSSESGLFIPFLANLPELLEEPCGTRRDGEGASEHVLKAKAQERSFKKAEGMVLRRAEKSDGKEWPRTVAGKSQILYKELLVEVNPKPSSSSQEQELPKIPVLDAKSVSTQHDLQRKWEETLESLKENYSRIQEEYCNTRHANQLLEEKLQRIVQTMAEERQTWNQRIAELERLIRFQNVFCVSEKINVSGLLPKSGIQAQPGGENPMGLPFEPLLDVIPPPPPFKDRDSSTQSSPALADLTLESSKLGFSSEFDPARSNPPVAKSYLHPSPLSAWKPTKFCAECASVTEEEYGRKERGLVRSPPASCFLYLQEASTPSSTASPLPDSELGAFPTLYPSYLSGGPAASEHTAERSRWGRSDPADISRSPGLVEKILRPRLEHQPRPKMLDKRSEQEETPEKGTAWSRLHCVTVHEEGSGEELSSPGETDSEGKLRPRLQYRGAMLPQLSKGGGRKRQNFANVQDSTSL